jgi:hypothetical protein
MQPIAGSTMYLFQILIMTLIIGSDGAYQWAPKYGGVAVALLAVFAASWLSVWLSDLLLWVRRTRALERVKNEAAKRGRSGP